jgi:hypothetical protein
MNNATWPPAEGVVHGNVPGVVGLQLGEPDEDMGTRIFTGSHEFQGVPDNDWNMDIEWPQWINAVHNIALGKRCFIFGTGPSLVSQLPLLHLMRDEDTWTVNRMNKFTELPFTPTNHMITEPGPIGGFGKTIFPQYDYPTAKNRIAVSWWPVSAPGWLWCPKAPDDIHIRWEGFHGFDDRLPPIPTGWASPLTGCQLAAWMGYREFYFLGIDTTQLGQAWDVEHGRTLRPRNVRSIMECFDRARTEIELRGAKIIDCTPGGLMNQEGVLEYRPLEEVLA